MHRDGYLVPVVLAMAAFEDETGQPAGLIVVATDLSERHALEEALRNSETRANEANIAKSAFLAAMSHEIRTPMIGVTGMALRDEVRFTLHVRLRDHAASTGGQ